MDCRKVLIPCALFPFLLFPPSSAGATVFRRGDVNADGSTDVSDAIALLSSLFLDPAIAIPCLEAADANDDRELDLSDGVRLLSFLFLGGEPPPAPFDQCQRDPGPAGFPCESFPPCQSILEVAWVARHDGLGGGFDEAVAMVLDREGNILVTGKESLPEGSAFGTVKYAPDGRELWFVRYHDAPASLDHPFAIAADGDGNVIVTGQSIAKGSSSSHAVTVKYDPSGRELWAVGLKSYWGGGLSLDLDRDGDIFLAAETQDAVDKVHLLAVKYGPQGQEVWRSSYEFSGLIPSHSASGRIAVDGSGGVRVAVENDFSHCGTISTLLRYGPDGGRLWSVVQGEQCSRSGWIDSLAVDTAGNTLAAGTLLEAGAEVNSGFLTFKYDREGGEVWKARYEGPEGGGTPLRLRQDPSGNVYVTGFTLGKGTAEDYTTVKYDRDGLELWAVRQDGGAKGRDVALDLVVDGSGNVFVTGESDGPGSGKDWLTVMYDSQGRKVRSARHNGPANGEDHARAIAVDASGNLYVAGSSTDLATGQDFVTIKYLPPR